MASVQLATIIEDMKNPVQTALNDLGLGSFVSALDQYHGGDVELVLHKSFRLKASEMLRSPAAAADQLRACFAELSDGIMESYAVRQALKKERDRGIVAETALAELKERVEQLERYETYYRLAFALHHGEDVGGVKL